MVSLIKMKFIYLIFSYHNFHKFETQLKRKRTLNILPEEGKSLDYFDEGSFRFLNFPSDKG